MKIEDIERGEYSLTELQQFAELLMAEHKAKGRKLHAAEFVELIRRWRTEDLDEEWTAEDEVIAASLIQAGGKF